MSTPEDFSALDIESARIVAALMRADLSGDSEAAAAILAGADHAKVLRWVIWALAGLLLEIGVDPIAWASSLIDLSVGAEAERP